MTGKPTYEELERRVHDPEQAEIERRRVEKELRISKKLLRDVMDMVPAGCKSRPLENTTNLEKGRDILLSLSFPRSSVGMHCGRSASVRTVPTQRMGTREYLRDHRVDLLLLDMIMAPGMDGRETYERVIALHPGQKALPKSSKN